MDDVKITEGFNASYFSLQKKGQLSDAQSNYYQENRGKLQKEQVKYYLSKLDVFKSVV